MASDGQERDAARRDDFNTIKKKEDVHVHILFLHIVLYTYFRLYRGQCFNFQLLILKGHLTAIYNVNTTLQVLRIEHLATLKVVNG